MLRKIGLVLAFLFFVTIFVLLANRSWAVVPYPGSESANLETQAAPQLQDLGEKFKEHVRLQNQSFAEIRRELMQIREKDALTARDNIFWRRVSGGLFLFNFLLIILLLKKQRS